MKTPHYCDTCDANCNFTISTDKYDDENVPYDTRVYVRNLKLAGNELFDLVIRNDSLEIVEVNEKVTEMQQLLSLFRDKYNQSKRK